MSRQSEFLVPLALVERLLESQESERVTFRQTLLDILDRQQEMIGTIHQHQVGVYTPPAEPVSYAPSLYTGEEEQDLRYMQEADLITKEELEEALRDMNFHNAEIDIG